MISYDRNDKNDIERHAKNAIDKTFREILYEGVEIRERPDYVYTTSKGNLGNLVEEFYFGYKPNSNSGPDFKEAGVELKVTPFKKNKNGLFSAKERLVLNIINYKKVVLEKFDNSTFLEKNALLLLLYYLWEQEKDKLDYVIKYSSLYSFPSEDLKIIKQDWEKIVDKIKTGKAHEISESDTYYLGACTKGSTADKSYVEQPYSSQNAKQRAFSLKASYMTVVLRKIISNEITYEPIIKDIKILDKETLENYIIEKFKPNFGLSAQELEIKYNIQINPKSKAYYFALAKKILEVQSNRIEEFEKANIKIKAIRVQNNGKIKEHMSFPAFRYLELSQERWKDSSLREMFNTTKYFFIIFKEDSEGIMKLNKVLFWNMPLEDLETDVRKVWLKAVKKMRRGEFSELPKVSENEVLHIRPHATNSKDTYPTSTGENLPKKSFWLNKKYILKIINEAE